MRQGESSKGLLSLEISDTGLTVFVFATKMSRKKLFQKSRRSNLFFQRSAERSRIAGESEFSCAIVSVERFGTRKYIS